MMQEITQEECKRIQLNILVNVAEFCDEHDIKYSLAYGTLIGAIRHKGFIPWDDDIDIIMMRDEYERFVSLYEDSHYKLVQGKDMPNRLHVRVTDPDTCLLFSEERRKKFEKFGLWIDIFPIDKVMESKEGYNRLLKKIKFFVNLQTTGELWRKGFLAHIAHILLMPFPSLFASLAKKEMMKYNNTSSSRVASLAVWYLYSPSFPATYLDDFVEIDFEGYHFKSIKRYDDYLRGIYGDYMQLPPENQRKHRHEYVAYWKGK